MMQVLDCRNRFWLFALCALFSSTLNAQMPGATPTERVRGQIVSLYGNDLQMRADSGETFKAKLADNYRLSAVSPGDLSKLAAGAYIGVAAMPQPDGTLKAIDVRVFPETMRGTGEGHRPMDARVGSTMTNATVTPEAAPVGRTMTNATVSDVKSADTARKITLKYASGEKVVVLQADTPVLMIEAGNKDMLLSGARIVVSISTQADGSLLIDRVTVGVNGAVPPL
jgi:hypothetical protein